MSPIDARHLALPAVLLSVLLGACGSKPVSPTDKLALVENVVAVAKEKQAYNFAPLEIKLAEDKLQKAKELMGKEEYEEAGTLLNQALADARLAESKSEAARAQKSAEEMEKSVDLLRRETTR